MRIIAGKYKGKVLKEFKGQDIRPTSDRARQALFNILQNKVYGSIFYDAFSGTGGVGIEALSRGAEQVVFTDVDKKSIEIIKANLLSVKESDKEVFQCSAVDYLSRTSLKFDTIFLDPPYASEYGKLALEIIAKRNLLQDDGIVVFEHKTGDNCVIDGLILTDTRKYGICEFSFYRMEK